MRLRLKTPRLQELLASSALSQNHWALKVGLSRGHWSEIVNGKHPWLSAKTRSRILEVFDVPLDTLFEIEAGVAPWADVDFRRAISDRYLIDMELGQGGMGAVYLARDVRHGRPVAVKVIAQETVTGIGLDQFAREISTVARLLHPHILPLFDSGDAAGQPFYVMPYVRGGSLRTRLAAQTRLGLREALPLANGMATALHHAHGERVLHCDVKPENVLLFGDHAWMMDFGIARKLHSEIAEWTLKSELDLSAGTPAYVSPEQAAGDRDLDARSDVYSLGCLLFEILSGRPPFEGTSTQQVVAQRFILPPPPLRDLAPDVPATVQRVLERAMALPREHRQDSALAFARELNEAAHGASRAFAVVNVNVTRVASAARRRFGLGGKKSRQPAGGIVFDIMRDLTFAWRGLQRAPGFALAVMLTLGLAIGANATMFGIVDRLLLQPPPGVGAAQQVYRVEVARWFNGALGEPGSSASYPAFTDLRDHTRTLSDVAAVRWTDISYGVGRHARRLDAIFASGRYFALLRTRPAFGRFFGEADDTPGSPGNVAVISYPLWRGAFNGDSSVLGRTLVLDGRPVQVIGVAPRGFHGTDLGLVDIWLPLRPTLSDSPGGAVTNRGYQFLEINVRVKDGVSAEAAAADVRAAYAAGHADYREYESKAVAGLAPIAGVAGVRARTPEGRMASWLFGMAAIVLLIACANLGNLLLARGVSRRGEIAVRRALGISGRRLLRQLLAESLLLAALGCIAGLVIARWGGGFARALLLPDTAWDGVPLSGRILVFTMAATVAAAVLAGLVPLWYGARVDIARALHGASRSMIGYPRRILAGLLLVQIALSTVLLVGSGLFVRSLRRVQAIDLGFAPAKVLMVALTAPPGASVSERAGLYRDAAERLRRVPGVDDVGSSIGGPFLNIYAVSVRAPGMDSLPRLAGGGPYYYRLSAGALEALGVHLLRGRLFAEADDRPGAAPTVIITQTLATTLWPAKDPLSQCLIVSNKPCAPVIGVVADLHRQGLQERPSFLLFTPVAQDSTAVPEVMFVRVSGAPERMIEAIRKDLVTVRSDLPYVAIDPYDARIGSQARAWRLGAIVFTAFGVVSLLMAAVGVYGVLSYGVTQRTPEFGIRAALGATPARVMRMIFVSGLGVTAAGIVVGAGVAYMAAGRVQPLLFETSARDPFVFAAAAVAIGMIAGAATLIPGRRAARIDPLRAWRAE